MSTLEATVSLLEMLPESELATVRRFIVENIIKNNPYQKLTEEKLLDDLATSRTQYEAGEYTDMSEAIQEIGERYRL